MATKGTKNTKVAMDEGNCPQIHSFAQRNDGSRGSNIRRVDFTVFQYLCLSLRSTDFTEIGPVRRQRGNSRVRGLICGGLALE